MKSLLNQFFILDQMEEHTLVSRGAVRFNKYHELKKV